VIGAGLGTGVTASDGPSEADLASVEQARDSAEAKMDQLATENRDLQDSNARLRRKTSSLSGRVRGLETNLGAAAPSLPEPADSGMSSLSSGTWIAQLGSFSSQTGAEQRAAELQGQGFPAQVLWSSDYSGLNPGYWVAYAGFYDKFTAEQEAQRAVGLGVSDAFANNSQ
jgi:cell division protein FtsN